MYVIWPSNSVLAALLQLQGDFQTTGYRNPNANPTKPNPNERKCIN